MSYHNHIDPNNLAQIPSYTDQHLTTSSTSAAAADSHQSVLRTHIISDHSSSAAAAAAAAAASSSTAPTWLNSAILRQQSAAAAAGGGHYSDGSFLHLQTNSDEVNASADSIMAAAAAADQIGERGGGGGGGEGSGEMVTWQSERWKAEILGHPLYEQLLSAHVACLRIATPVDQLPRIDAQLAQSQHVVAKYSVLGNNQHIAGGGGGDDKELDQFMVRK